MDSLKDKSNSPCTMTEFINTKKQSDQFEGLREGYYGWFGYGGSSFIWNPREDTYKILKFDEYSIFDMAKFGKVRETAKKVLFLMAWPLKKTFLFGFP